MIKVLKRIGLILLGNFLCATATVLFIVPAGFMSGGLTGFALAFHQFFGLPISVGIGILSILMLLIGGIFLGKSFAVNSVLGALSYPVFVGVLEFLIGFVDITTDNLFLNLSGAAILMGIGIATVMRQGASSGSIDTIAIILNKKFGFSLSLMIYLFEVLAMSTQIFYSTPEQIMGGILMVLAYSVLMNNFLARGVARVQVMVYSKHNEVICDYIVNELERGCTRFHAEGGYTREEGIVLQAVIDNRELFKLKEYIRKVDPVAFITVSKMSEVGGRGFSIDKHAPDKQNGEEL